MIRMTLSKLADFIFLDILKEGYICPRQERTPNPRRCGKGSASHKADTAKPTLVHGGNFVKKAAEERFIPAAAVILSR